MILYKTQVFMKPITKGERKEFLQWYMHLQAGLAEPNASLMSVTCYLLKQYKRHHHCPTRLEMKIHIDK